MEKEIPEHNVPMNWISGGYTLIQVYGELGNINKVRDIANKLWKNSEQYVNWYTSLSPRKFQNSQSDCYMHLQMLGNVVQQTSQYDEDWASKHEAAYGKLAEKYQRAGGENWY